MTSHDTEREVIRCRRCRLVQFLAASQLCRKCGARLRGVLPEEPVMAPEPAAPQMAQPSFSVAVRLKTARMAKHLSQLQLADLINAPRTYISKIENRRCVPSLGSLAKLAEALGVPIADLVENERGRRAKFVAELLADPFLAQIAEAVPLLSHTHRGMLLVEAQKMAEYNMRREARKVAQR